jgi:uncharacterized protein (TIGR00730 family)
MGRLLAERGLELVYGGSKLGLMGILADACLEAGGRVVGVIPRALVEKEIAHTGISELHSVDSMHARKALMADKADAFIAMPGGYGTWEEFCEVLTWSQLGLQRKPCGVLNVNGYYEPMLAMADRAVAEGFLKSEHRTLLLAETDPEELLKRLERVPVPALEKWIDRRNR